MADQPNEALLESKLTPYLEDNIDTLRTILQMPENKDVVMREINISGVPSCLFFMDGMAGNAYINDNILYPCRTFGWLEKTAPEDRVAYLVRNVIDISDVSMESSVSELIRALLDGKTLLLVDACDEAAVMETRAYEKRNVDKASTEPVVIGAQQGFVENMRTNLTLVRRIVRSPMLVSEISSVGKSLPTNLSIIYLKGVANEQVLGELRRRIESLDVDAILDCGHLSQLIEERPFSLIPQTIQTERPDRAAYLITEGRIAVLVDNSPFALIVPVSFFDLLETADDSFLRWPHATFNRLIRLMGFMISLMMPALYVALTLYHSQMMPIELLASIAESRANVPFPVFIEVLIMEFSFYLINEAGTRVPSQIGSVLGIVGALILGQAAVAASLISPLLIIVTALSGLGNYAIASYHMALTVEILRIGLLVMSGLLGLYGLTLGLFLYVCIFCSVESFGQPYMAPVAPWRPNGEPHLFQTPLWRKNRLPFYVSGGSWMKRTPDSEKMRAWEGKRK